jgi:hypothetical protein
MIYMVFALASQLLAELYLEVTEVLCTYGILLVPKPEEEYVALLPVFNVKSPITETWSVQVVTSFTPVVETPASAFHQPIILGTDDGLNTAVDVVGVIVTVGVTVGVRVGVSVLVEVGVGVVVTV